MIGNNNVNKTIYKSGNKKYNEKYICCFFTIFLFRTSIYFTIIKLILSFSYSFHIPCIILSKVYFIFPFHLIDRNRKQVLLIKCFIFVLKLKKFFFSYFQLFDNAHIPTIVLTLINVVKLDVQNRNIVSTLSNVVNINVQRCKFQRWHTQCFFNADLTLPDVATSYHPNSNVETTLKCFLGIEECC